VEGHETHGHPKERLIFNIRAFTLMIAAAVTVAAFVSLACSQEETEAVTYQP
jgi:hypothetical protein